jgi:hypothetical protein
MTFTLLSNNIFLLCVLMFEVCQLCNGTVYRISSTNENVVIVGEHKYRESVGGDQSQLIFESNEHPNTFQNVDEYENYTLVSDNIWWNLITTREHIVLYNHTISLDSNTENMPDIVDMVDSDVDLMYAHNVQLYSKEKIFVSVQINGEQVSLSKDQIGSVFLKLQYKNVDKINIVLSIINPHKSSVQILSHKGNGYEQNANCWVWYKQIRKNLPEQLDHTDDRELIEQNSYAEQSADESNNLNDVVSIRMIIVNDDGPINATHSAKYNAVTNTTNNISQPVTLENNTYNTYNHTSYQQRTLSPIIKSPHDSKENILKVLINHFLYRM